MLRKYRCVLSVFTFETGALINVHDSEWFIFRILDLSEALDRESNEKI